MAEKYCGSVIRRTGSGYGYRFPDEVIVLAVRWYLRYRLSYVDVVEWLAERSVMVDPSTVYDWVRTLAQWAPPRFVAAARAKRSPVGRRWRIDETYLKIGGRWHYLYRAIDEEGQIVDIYLSERRNAAVVQAFFEGAIATRDVAPTQVTADKAKSYSKALRTLLPAVEHRTSKYLNKRIERDLQHLKGRVQPMRRFKTTARASNFCRV